MQASKKAILFLDQYAGLAGGQKVLLDIVEAFSNSKKGYKCIAALPGEGLLSERMRPLGISVKFFPIGYYSISQKNIFDCLNYFLRLPLLFFLLTHLIRKEKIDLVYANGARTFAWATLACSATNRPLFWHIHSIFDKGLTKKTCLFFGKFNAVKKIFVVSKVAASPLNALGAKLEVIYNAVKKVPPPEDAGLLKREFGLAGDAFLVGNIAILEEWKNQEDLISFIFLENIILSNFNQISF